MTVLLVLLAGTLAVLLYSQAGALREERQQLQELRAKLDSVTKAAGLEAQEKCAKKAHEAFELRATPLGYFTNHYNSRLNKCFVRIDTLLARPGLLDAVVLDSFEGRGYAHYMGDEPRSIRLRTEKPPLVCETTIPSGEKKRCGSLDEFEALVKYYME